MKSLAVLSFGSTRGLWDGPEAEDYQRMMSYAAHLREYVVVASSYKQHALERLHLSPHVEAIPSNAFTPLDSALRMLGIGIQVLRRREMSLIQAQDPLISGPVAVILGKWFKIPVNVCVYGPNVYDGHWVRSSYVNWILAPMARWVLRECSGIQVDGMLTARRLIDAGHADAQIEVKPLVPANLNGFLQIERPPQSSGRPVQLLYVGRLAKQKNLPLLLETVEALRTRTKQCYQLTIVGEGPEESRLRSIVEANGLSGLVTFRGQITRPRIVEVFAEADILVLTSDYEGFPRVLMEAAAAGLPIVTTAVSGSDEAIAEGETGYCVPIRDREAIVSRLALLVNSSALRQSMGAAARELIRSKLDPSSNAPRQAEIWRKVALALRHKDIALERPAFPRRLLVFNLVTDSEHPILGFTSQWLRALAARVESIEVITMRAGKIDLPENVHVHSVGKERGYSESRRTLEFYRHLFRILRSGRIDGCFSHMIQVFSALAGPVLRARGIPLVTWYAHPKRNLSLKIAHRFSNRMVTSLPGAYPHHKDKVSVIGQGIDTDHFSPDASLQPEPALILCVGRISRVKNHETLLRAVAQLRENARVVILGTTAGADDVRYAAELRAMVSELGLTDVVRFEPPVSLAELPSWYRRCAVHVNLTPVGFGDKVAWEAMSSGRPCLVANEDFGETLGDYANDLLFGSGIPSDLAAKLDALLRMTDGERAEIGNYLRSQVERLHSLPRLADRILSELAKAADARSCADASRTRIPAGSDPLRKEPLRS